jgi:hypothetical protein
MITLKLSPVVSIARTYTYCGERRETRVRFSLLVTMGLVRDSVVGPLVRGCGVHSQL